jgi:dolichol-phosphate mannosyltransferase
MLLKQQNSGVNVKVIWVNDCSSDQTAQKINKTVQQYSGWNFAIHHSQNRNLVGVLETTFSRYHEFVEDNEQLLGIGLLDGDYSHPPAFFSPMIDKLKLGYDVAIASRFQVGSIIRGVPPHRELFSIVMSFLFRSFGRIPNVRDYSCGYRAYSAAIAKKLNTHKFERRSFACMVELLCVADKHKATICEVPFILRYDLKLSSSKMKVVKTILETLQVLIKR